MTWDVELAKQFKARDNKNGIGPLIGSVISIEPVKISILENKAILTSENSYLCSNIVNNYSKKSTITINGTTNDSEILFKEVLKVGDHVLCIPTEDGQRFFIIDKVVM